LSFVLRCDPELGWSLVLSRGLASRDGYIDVLEDLPGGDAENAFGRFDEVVAFASGVLTPEKIGEGEGGGELLGFDQKAGAIGDPWGGCFHECLNSVLGAQFPGDERDGCCELRLVIPRCFRGRLPSWPRYDFLLRANQNVRAKERAVNSVFLVQLMKMVATKFHGLARIKNFFRDRAVSRLEGLGTDCGGASGEKVRGVGQRIVHRGCTGNAERQWSVASGQWSVRFLLASLGGRRRGALSTLAVRRYKVHCGRKIFFGGFV
jgi:hypothetical protein